MELPNSLNEINFSQDTMDIFYGQSSQQQFSSQQQQFSSQRQQLSQPSMVPLSMTNNKNDTSINMMQRPQPVYPTLNRRPGSAFTRVPSMDNIELNMVGGDNRKFKVGSNNNKVVRKLAELENRLSNMEQTDWKSCGINLAKDVVINIRKDIEELKVAYKQDLDDFKAEQQQHLQDMKLSQKREMDEQKIQVERGMCEVKDRVDKLSEVCDAAFAKLMPAAENGEAVKRAVDEVGQKVEKFMSKVKMMKKSHNRFNATSTPIPHHSSISSYSTLIGSPSHTMVAVAEASMRSTRSRRKLLIGIQQDFELVQGAASDSEKEEDSLNSFDLLGDTGLELNF